MTDSPVLDVKEGDLLVVDGVEYPVKSVKRWTVPLVTSRSFQYMATVQAVTKRNPDVVNGKRGEPVVHLALLNILPLDPVDEDVQTRAGMGTPVKRFQTSASVFNEFILITVEELQR